MSLNPLFPFMPTIVPNIVQALVVATAFALLCAKPLHKQPLPFYAAFIAASALTFVPAVKDATVVRIMASAYTGVAFYLLVMFAGALPRKWEVTRKLLSIRSELSILAGFIILAHSARVIFMVPVSFMPVWSNIWGDAAPYMLAATSFVGVPLLICFLVPWITSFKRVRRRMKGTTWKKVQRLAYPFMALLVAQGMLLAVAHALYVGPTSEDFATYVITGCLYATLGIVYAALKFYGVLQRKRK
ncbi:hypothetical protein [Denitrobacterium detoxificans]|uniref:hypothetical protein n=1 Tax=Denitrobacterium detoxificans TaxID=79604 RepID=UPI000B33A6D2|nr:hypothetical protein [Denitrobacterium detoxificans]